MRWSPLALPDARDQLLGVTSRQIREARIHGGEWVTKTVENARNRGEVTDNQIAPLLEELNLQNIAGDMAMDLQNTYDAVAAAQLTWVTRDMTHLALDASRDIPDWTPNAVVPFPSGLLVWEGGMPLIPLALPLSDEEIKSGWRNRESKVGVEMVPLSGIVWGPAKTGELMARSRKYNESRSVESLPETITMLGFGAINVTMLANVDNVREQGLTLNRRFGESRLVEIGTFVLPGRFSDEVTPTSLFAEETCRSQQLVFDARIGSTVDVVERVGTEARETMTAVINAIGATWSLMMQPQISHHARTWHDPDPNRRGKPPRKTGEVTIIDLRPMRTAAMPREVEGLTGKKQYTCRWVVRGHWRQQACGPNRSLRKPVWIASYIAGPEGMPLKVTEHVHVWRR